MNTSSPKIRRTRAQWTELLKQYRASGQTQTAFCEAHRVPISSFTRALRRARDAPGDTLTDDDFVPVSLEELPSTVTSQTVWDIELSLGADVVLRLRRS